MATVAGDLKAAAWRVTLPDVAGKIRTPALRPIYIAKPSPSNGSLSVGSGQMPYPR